LSANAELVGKGDLDELGRHAERLATARAWDELVDLRDRCRAALARGKQLWPIASRVEYLLALQAPAVWAAPVVVDGAGLFAPGPLAEVVASEHSWAELAAHLVPGPLAAVVLHERVLRGEDLREAVEAAGLDAYLDLPAVLQDWEPRYPLATYTPEGVEVDEPPRPSFEEVVLGRGPTPVDDPVATDALRELVGPWVASSNGRVDAVAVAGGATDAIAAAADRAASPREVRLAPLDRERALAFLAWTGASGGAHGRRRGAATGRLNAWWAVAALAGLDDEWPAEPGELAAALSDLRWYRWEPAGPATGWRFHLAVEDPDEGLAWAVAAHDRA
jgi:hypothetical protein